MWREILRILTPWKTGRKWNTLLLSCVVFCVIFVHRNMTRRIESSDLQHGSLNASVRWYELFAPVPALDCTAYIEGDEDKIEDALALQSPFNHPIVSDETFVELTKDCDEYKKQRGYLTVSSEEEDNFPIAFSILLYKEAEQAERLLLAIYRPQNWYCIHVDGHSPPVIHTAMQAIAKCFPNVFVSSKSEKVVYSGFSRLMADINCMKDLVSNNMSWKYFINLPSQAFPLRTNSELVKILKIYNGANDIEGITGGRSLSNRFRYKHILVKDSVGDRYHIEMTSQLNGPPPHNITVVKGSAYGVFSRPFVQFIIEDRRAQDFLNWCKDVNSPDEYFWATLHHQGRYGTFQVPGGYNGDPDRKSWLATYAAWQGVDPCRGKWVRSVCVFGLGDISRLAGRRELFANKFFLDYHPFALDCMAEWIRNKSLSNVPSDLYFYRQQVFIKRTKNIH